MIILSVMVMNKRGQLGGEDTNMLKILGSIFLVVVVVWAIAYAVNNSGSKANAGIAQLPDDVAAISVACKLAVESGKSFLDGAYCTQAREVSYKGFLGIFGGNKAWVNCEYAKTNNWFTLDVAKPGVKVPTCDPDWARKYCEELMTRQGDKYKDTVVVNGQTCKARGVNAPVVKTATSDKPNPSPTPVVKTCLEQGGQLETGVTCADQDFTLISSSDSVGGKICCRP
jgi:hypothetical protein